MSSGGSDSHFTSAQAGLTMVQPLSHICLTLVMHLSSIHHTTGVRYLETALTY